MLLVTFLAKIVLFEKVHFLWVYSLETDVDSEKPVR